MRDRLIELIKNAPVWKNGTFNEACELVADHLIENGVILPPCKVGDTVYSKNGKPYVVEGIHYKNGRFMFGGSRDGIEGMPQKVWFENEINKTVFLSKEEAEKALKE